MYVDCGCKVTIDFHTKLVELRRLLREVYDPPLRRLHSSLPTFTQDEITSAVLRVHPHIDTKGMDEYVKAWRRCQVSAQFSCFSY